MGRKKKEKKKKIKVTLLFIYLFFWVKVTLLFDFIEITQNEPIDSNNSLQEGGHA